MTLVDGQSELDSLVLRVAGQECKTWDHISLHSSFLVPTDELTFTLSGVDDVYLCGTPLALELNGKAQFSGFLDKKRIQSSRSSGKVITCTGRDILGPVINSNVSSKKRFSEGASLLDLVAAVLVPLGITRIYNDGSLNVNLQTGATQKPTVASAALLVQLPQATLAADQTVTQSFTTVSATSSVSAARPDLAALKLTQLKPHPGEGAYQYIDRLLKRFGLRMWAAADGTGVIIDHANFAGTPTHTLRHTSTVSDIASAELEMNWECQPSCIIAEGVGAGDASEDHRPMTVIMVNELVGTDGSGNILPEINDIIASFQGVTVLPLRPQLAPARRDFAATIVCRPMFVKDDQSRTPDQLANFVRREMANRQNKALHYKVHLDGLTLNGVPFATNALVSVQDDVFDIHENLWVLEKDFEKSRGGTFANLTMIRPYTLALDAA